MVARLPPRSPESSPQSSGSAGRDELSLVGVVEGLLWSDAADRGVLDLWHAGELLETGDAAQEPAHPAAHVREPRRDGCADVDEGALGTDGQTADDEQKPDDSESRRNSLQSAIPIRGV